MNNIFRDHFFSLSTSVSLKVLLRKIIYLLTLWIYKTPWRNMFHPPAYHSCKFWNPNVSELLFSNLQSYLQPLQLLWEVFSFRWPLVKFDPKCRNGTKNLRLWGTLKLIWGLVYHLPGLLGKQAYAIVFAVRLHQQLISPFSNSSPFVIKLIQFWKLTRGSLVKKCCSTRREKEKRTRPLFVLCKQCNSQPVCLLPTSRGQGVKGGHLHLQGEGRIRQRSQTQRKSDSQNNLF